MRRFAAIALRSAFAAALGASSVAAVAASSDFLLTLPPGKGELAGAAKSEQIEMHSFHWGPRQSTSADGSIEQAGQKRQHSPVTFSKPLERGSLTIQGSHPGCTAGQRYSGAQFASANMRYELKDVVITNCAAESLSLNYGKVTVRGWDPEKKQ